MPGPARPAIRLTKKHDRNAEGKAHCLRDRPDDQKPIRGHHAAPAVPSGDIYQVDSLT